MKGIILAGGQVHDYIQLQWAYRNSYFLFMINP